MEGRVGRLVVLVLLGLVEEGRGFCWKPNINPFLGSPQTERVRGERRGEERREERRRRGGG